MGATIPLLSCVGCQVAHRPFVAEPVCHGLLRVDDQRGVKDLEDALEVAQGQLRLARQDAAQVTGVDSGLLADAVAE